MENGFWGQLGVMALVFGLALTPALASRRMERSDYFTLVAIPPSMFLVAVLPGLITFGFNKDSATYILGMVVVVAVATLNYRFQPKLRRSGDPEKAVVTAAPDAPRAPKEA